MECRCASLSLLLCLFGLKVNSACLGLLVYCIKPRLRHVSSHLALCTKYGFLYGPLAQFSAASGAKRFFTFTTNIAKFSPQREFGKKSSKSLVHLDPKPILSKRKLVDRMPSVSAPYIPLVRSAAPGNWERSYERTPKRLKNISQEIFNESQEALEMV